MKATIPLIVLAFSSWAFGQATLPAARGRGAGGTPVMVDLYGVVLDDETSKPVENFVIQTGRTTPTSNGRLVWGVSSVYNTMRRPEGKFQQRITYLADQKINYRILADGYVPQPVIPEAVDPPGRFGDLVVRLKRGPTVRGVILDHLGNPVEAARVMLGGYRTITLASNLTNSPTTAPDTVASGVKTDAQGRFALSGISSETQERILITSPNGSTHALVSRFDPTTELTIRLPEPATLVVNYDIPSAEQETTILMQRINTNEPAWRSFSVEYQPRVKNKSRVEFKGLTPGSYDMTRQKMLRPSLTGRGNGVALDRKSAVLLEPGKTTEVSWVRKTGYSVHGEVAGVAGIGFEGATLYVRLGEATGAVRSTDDNALPLHDVQTLGPDGSFDTALLEPGTYSLLVRLLPTRAVTGGTATVGIAPTHVGMTKVTITAGEPPSPALIVLQPAIIEPPPAR